MKNTIVVLALCFASLAAVAQAPAPPDAPVAIQNIYAVGVSYNNGASVPVAGTALYAHAVDDAGTYAYTVFDAVPNTLKPFTVTSNVSVGVAQKVVTIGGVPVYIPTSAGVSVSGPNTGYNWNTGVMAAVKLKKGWYVFPTVRVIKSSVSGGTGYQPIATVLIGKAK